MKSPIKVCDAGFQFHGKDLELYRMYEFDYDGVHMGLMKVLTEKGKVAFDMYEFEGDEVVHYKFTEAEGEDQDEGVGEK